MVREAKQDRNLRFLEFFQPQPQPCVFSTSNDSEHLLTISYKSYMYTYLLQKWFRCLKTSANASPQRIYIYINIYIYSTCFNWASASKSSTSANLPSVKAAKMPHCYHWYSTRRFPTFQSTRVSRHRYSRPGFDTTHVFLFFFRRNSFAERWVLGESKIRAISTPELLK